MDAEKEELRKVQNLAAELRYIVQLSEGLNEAQKKITKARAELKVLKDIAYIYELLIKNQLDAVAKK